MSRRFAVMDLRNGRCLGDRVERAEGFLGRLRGLLGRTGLAEGEGLILDHCASVHTCFMRFPIDLCFIAADARVLRTVDALPPWRTATAFGASGVIELPAGTLGRAKVREGDALEVMPCA